VAFADLSTGKDHFFLLYSFFVYLSTTELDASDKWMSRRLLTIHSPFSLKKNVETSSFKFLLFVFLFKLSPTKRRFSVLQKLLHFYIFITW